MSEKITLKERKRRAILDASIDLFVEHGYRQTSMDAISARAEVSKRTLYNHFSSKELLFQAIARQMFEQSALMTAIEYVSDASLARQLDEFAARELNMLAKQSFLRLARVMIAECIQSPELSARAMAEANVQKSGLENWIVSAQQEKRITDNREAPYLATQFIGLIKGHAFWPQILMGQAVPDTGLSQMIRQDAVKMFLACYACESEL
ncbi:TetR/AcrR family transcriptional regulator [Oceanospirillum sediminis]|uniref:TetR/AcrR family transcriptional regulator n=1 Tax=Oceanospirillum sediminis TaxID=2760088 RepID=A0A839IN66_9GAMM|nr:TetR/AcrR family transcriptional regulator [Oceanospirillum sediminis]MBB1486388.1 TetR/AcrR family transcriptional regulator [Oceanospirillum sediminis]